MLKIAWSEIFAHSLPEGHRFPMLKYDLLPEQLLYEGTITHHNLFKPGVLQEEYILDTHDADYWKRLHNLELTPSEVRKTGFPLSKELVNREVVIMNGTVQAALFALEYGIGMNIAGGTHHAFTNRGEGFCLLNDIGIAANHLLKHKGIHKVLVVDLDVHQGNGTAEIFRHEPRVFTFSMHCGHNYPFHKEESDMDVPLADGTDDKTYLDLLQQILPRLLDEVQPEFVFFQSGVDVLSTDKLGKLSMSIQGCKDRDRLVLELCQRNKLPVAVSMGGGYSKQIAHIIEAHANTFRLAQHIFF
ncbi:histone deacetylase [Pontibacter silvestris]|uniref:Histone deacetylase n=1 Tax=Pontibacter silvestris TaxID=2305183 RepID=A0ABW4WT50_9BACT|nr:histone deacetylase [Pontibacter silvestris]MCC9138761.1 histone deacetylase [Pontibacter silvestris]